MTIMETKYGAQGSSKLNGPSLRNKSLYRKTGNYSLKKIKFHSKSCGNAIDQERVFIKLDPKIPEQAHKIQQRRKAISKGKNTIGYDRYSRSIPRERRQKGSMVTPSTPDHTLDIPNRKWNGLVRSWRVALHKYDPVDLQNSFSASQKAPRPRAEDSRSSRAIEVSALTVKAKEVADSALSNLVEVSEVQHRFSLQQRRLFSSRSPVTTDVLNFKSFDTPQEKYGSNESGVVKEVNQWEVKRQDSEEMSFLSMEEDDHSDDDLL